MLSNMAESRGVDPQTVFQVPTAFKTVSQAAEIYFPIFSITSASISSNFFSIIDLVRAGASLLLTAIVLPIRKLVIFFRF